MPTAAKLIAALCLAIVAWLTSEAIRPLFPAGTDFGNFNYINAAIGLVLGWIILGARAGRGYAAGISNGVTASVSMVLWGLFIHATSEMVDRSFRRLYDSPFEAVGAIFEIALEYGADIMDLRVIVVVLVGGIVAGLVTEAAGQRWS